MSDFSLSNTQTLESNPEARAQLDAALSSFASNTPLVGSVVGSVNSQPTAEVVDSDELTPALEAPAETEGEETEEHVEETEETGEDEPELSAFDEEFSKRFGVKPEEAVSTINELLAFKDEMTLMRGWGVTAGEYDLRMTAVKEFYNTLPEDKQPEFNSLEGAKAIWAHLEKTSPGVKRNSTVSKVGSGKKPAAAKPTKAFIKKSDILSMPAAEYQKRLPEINAAFREGRVLENA